LKVDPYLSASALARQEKRGRKAPSNIVRGASAAPALRHAWR
jgi:hypothetical protein